jgi:magnesium-transporting ATPase (P-type)
MGVWWYRVHVGLRLGITGLLSLISFILIVLNVQEPHFDGSHQKIGLAIFILMFIQFALGFISNALWDPQRTHAPWWDKVHWYFGRGLIILAVINIYLGIEEFSEVTGESMVGLIIGYWIWIGILFSMFLLGQFYFGGTQHHKESPKTSEDLSE